MSTETARPPGLLDNVRFVLVMVGYGTLALGALGLALIWGVPGNTPGVLWGLGAAVVLLVVAALAGAERFRGFLGARLRPTADVLVLGVLVLWGLFYNASGGGCVSPRAHGNGLRVYRALAEPEILGVLGLHTLTVLAYALSRRHPNALRGPLEPLVHAFLIAGIGLHGVLAVHLRGLALLGVVFPPLLPLAAPLFTILFYAEVLVSRLRQRWSDARDLVSSRQPVFRRGPPQPSIPLEPRLHRPTLARALALSVVLVGGWVGAQKALLGWAPLEVLTRTCGHTLSARPENADLEE